VWALNKMTGQLLWSTNSLGGGHSNNNLVFMDGHVYWAHGSGLHVFNEVSGELVHVEPAPDKTTFQLITANKGRIFAQSSRHLYAFAPWGHEEAIE
jgi:outer membrane protein assembly factor BamB